MQDGSAFTDFQKKDFVLPHLLKYMLPFSFENTFPSSKQFTVMHPIVLSQFLVLWK